MGILQAASVARKLVSLQYGPLPLPPSCPLTNHEIEFDLAPALVPGGLHAPQQFLVGEPLVDDVTQALQVGWEQHAGWYELMDGWVDG